MPQLDTCLKLMAFLGNYIEWGMVNLIPQNRLEFQTFIQSWHYSGHMENGGGGDHFCSVCHVGAGNILPCELLVNVLRSKI